MAQALPTAKSIRSTAGVGRKLNQILISRFFSHSPIVLVHRITSLCNSRCKNCNLWMEAPKHNGDLSREEVFAMLNNAAEAGMVVYSVWGGEPLMRKTLAEELRHAKGKGMVTILSTNGYFLKHLHQRIEPYVDFLSVSLDSDDELNDEMHGVEGTLANAIEGALLYKKSKGSIMINTVVSKLNLCKIDDLMALSRRLGIPIGFEPLNVIPGYNGQLVASREELKEAFSKIMNYKRLGYGVVNSMKYLETMVEKKGYVCHYPKLYVYVDPNGDIVSCQAGQIRWGNVKTDDLRDIFGSRQFKDFCRENEACNRCEMACIIEPSLIYSMTPPMLLEIIMKTLAVR
jgi:pyrroloquinoline quinone biosynthesis protein E